MRQSLASRLTDLQTRLTHELELAAGTLAEIGDAVHDPAVAKAESIARSGRRMRHSCRAASAELMTLMACHAPVAGDLRLVVSLIQLSAHEVLIANQFGLISQQLGEINARVPDGSGAADQLERMTMLASSLLRDTAVAFSSRDLVLARGVDREDDAIDRLNRQIFAAALDLHGPADLRERGLRHVLIARSVERIADNAVDIAEQTEFLVTAELHEFTDASRPKQHLG